jgi:glucose/arabinose dehydrogenase
MVTSAKLSHISARSCCMGAVAIFALALASCGGEDASAPPTANQAPVFTSLAAASLAENSSGAFYTAAANDPEGGALTYSIAGGADATAFAMSGNQLSFIAAPNYDLPGDTDGNNVYLVQLRASDGQAASTLDLQVTVTNSKEGISVRRVASGFNDPIAISSIPGDTRLFIAERGGSIFTLDPATGERTLFYSFNVSQEGDRGLRALAVSPNYVSDGRFFVLSTTSSGQVYINPCRRRGTFLTPSCFEDSAVAFEAHDRTDGYGTFMGYAPDGKLYVVTADAGGSRDPSGSAQNDASILGKLLRVDNNADPYAGASARFYQATTLAKGFHNPRGGSFYNGMLLLGDRGESAKDEIDLVSLAAGANYGWPAKEGTSVIASAAQPGLSDPVVEYPRSAGSGVVGGYVYRGQVASLKGQYIFADQNGTIFSSPVAKILAGRTLGPSELERRTADFAPDVGALRNPVAFGEDNAGDMYLLTTDGEVYKVSSST